MPILIQAYKPKCCNKVYIYKKNAMQHEKKCPNNPDNKACQTCKYRIVDYETVYNRYHNGIPGSTDYDVKYWWCDHYDKRIDMWSELMEEATRIKPKMNCEYWEEDNEIN